MSVTRPATRRPTGPASATTSTTSARFAARARAARWRYRRRLLVGAGGLLLLVAGAAFVWFGPVLVVREVTVRGVSSERAAQVLVVARAPYQRPLAQVDTAALVERVSTLPFVASVHVRRSWPRTLQLVVGARTPAAAVPLAGGGFRLVDAFGVGFTVAPKAPRGVPVVLADPGEGGRASLLAALQVLRGLPPALRAGVTAVSAASPDAVQLQVGGATVVWGSSAQTPRKVDILAALIRTPATVYDLSSPDTPVLR